MNGTDGSGLARGVFGANAIYTALCGLPLAVGAGMLAGPAGVPGAGIVRGYGLFLVVWAGVLGWVAWRKPFPRLLGLLTTIADGGYALLSGVFLALGGELVGAGARAFIGAVAVGVVVLVIGQGIALSRLGAAGERAGLGRTTQGARG